MTIQSKILDLKQLKPVHQHIQHIKQHLKTKYRSEHSISLVKQQPEIQLNFVLIGSNLPALLISWKIFSRRALGMRPVFLTELSTLFNAQSNCQVRLVRTSETGSSLTLPSS